MRLGLGLGVKNSGFVGGYDSATSAFLAATGITSKTESDAVNNLVIRLKSYGLWSKMKAIYPFVSDTYNLTSYTEDFDNWGKTAATVSVNTIVAPNGTTTADKIIPNTSNTSHQVSSSIISVTSGIPYTRSIYVKKGEYSNVVLSIGGFSAYNDWKYVAFNLDTNTFTAASSSTTYTSTIIGNGWVRLSFTVTPTSTNNDTFVIKVSNDPNNTSQNPSFAGDGTSGIYLWGAQWEQASSASTYQPIATTPANRFVSQFKYNLKDARDLDAAFRLAFNGTWTYSKQGATSNGTNAYARTYFVPSVHLTAPNQSASLYSRTNVASTSNSFDLSSVTTGVGNFSLNIDAFVAGIKAFVRFGLTQDVRITTAQRNDGYFVGSRTSATMLKLYRSNVILGTTTTADTGISTTEVPLGVESVGGTLSGYSAKQYAFCHIGDGLTDTEATNLYTSVQLFQQELSRYVGVPIVSDANAQAFLDAAVITDQTQANAVNTLVTDLKTYGLWTKMKAIYPFVGGTASTHKWNLKDPRDLDAAYRLAFSGAWTHSSTGALPNGANAYANTFFNQQGNWTSTSNGAMGLYLRTNSVGAYCDMGAGTISSGLNSSTIYSRFTGDVVFSGLNCSAVTPSSANTNSQGFHAVSRTNSTSYSRYKRGTSTINLTNTDSIGTNINRNIYLGAGNDAITAASYSNREIAYSFLGDGLTQSEIDLYYTAVQNFQTSLSRQV
jgi:hypothetical protein